MRIEALFEKILWHSRLVVLVPVVASLLVSFGMFYVSTVDVGTLTGHILHYHASAEAARMEARSTIVAHLVEVVDGTARAGDADSGKMR